MLSEVKEGDLVERQREHERVIDQRTGKQVVNVQSGTEYTITSDDIGSLIMFANEGQESTVLIPAYEDAPLSTGFWFEVLQREAQVTVDSGSGPSIEWPEGLSNKTRSGWSRVFVQQIAQDWWIMAGDLESE